MAAAPRRIRFALAVLSLAASLPAPAADPAAEEAPATAAPAATPPSPTPASPTPAAATPPSPKPEEAGMGEEIVITATRSPRAARDVTADVTVLGRAEVERNPGKVVDEILKVVPDFNTFRRSSSVSADPTSSGVSLRGVGPSAASRSLVLVDGIPANDAFKDNIWWRAIPPLSIERIEVVPGGGSALYGNYALGGVMQVVTRPIAPRTVDALAEYGSYNTSRVAAYASDRWGPVGASLEADLFNTDGYFVVAPYARGPIDTPAPSKHAVGSARLEAQASKDLLLTARGSFFYEDYNGGTQYTTADVRRWEAAAGARWTPGAVGELDLALFGHSVQFFQDRARVTTVNGVPRAQEALSAQQYVPANDLGASLVWRSNPLRLGGLHHLVAGVDARWIRGETQEALYPATVTATTVVQQNSGGDQQLYGVFAEDVWDVSDAVGITAALRYDHWSNLNASLFQERANATTSTLDYASRSDGQLDPRLGVRVRPVEWLTLRAAGYHAFRAPTLDELYRSFQVGTVRTFGNSNLDPETLWGAEVGVAAELGRAFAASATLYWNQLDNPIVNVTCPPPPGLPTGIPGTTCSAPNRQKQNLGQAVVEGVEAKATWRFAPTWSVGGAYLFVNARVTEAPGQPQLVGKELPQDPRNRASVFLAWDDPRLFTVSVQATYTGQQYEDDLNTLPMGAVWLLDASVAWHATRFLDVYVAGQNLLDTMYLVGRAGVDTIGQPLFIRGGVRVSFGP